MTTRIGSCSSAHWLRLVVDAGSPDYHYSDTSRKRTTDGTDGTDTEWQFLKPIPEIRVIRGPTSTRNVIIVLGMASRGHAF